MKIQDSTARILISMSAGIIVYILSAIILKQVIIPVQYGMMAFANPNYITMNILALLIGFFSATAIFLVTKPEEGKKELGILKKALSDDEKAIISELEKEDKITQDSLRFRLGWSKAKISTILTNLDKKGVVQRERLGKTYNVFLSKTV